MIYCSQQRCLVTNKRVVRARCVRESGSSSDRCVVAAASVGTECDVTTCGVVIAGVVGTKSDKASGGVFATHGIRNKSLQAIRSIGISRCVAGESGGTKRRVVATGGVSPKRSDTCGGIGKASRVVLQCVSSVCSIVTQPRHCEVPSI